MRIVSALLTVLAATSAVAQINATEYPADATPITTAALQEALSGQVFSVMLPDGKSWRMEFKSGGYYFFNSSTGFADNGKWSVQESRVCTEGSKIKPSCNDVRKQGEGLLLKRDNGEIVTMTVQ